VPAIILAKASNSLFALPFEAVFVVLQAEKMATVRIGKNKLVSYTCG
jgi:hypothetical protein